MATVQLIHEHFQGRPYTRFMVDGQYVIDGKTGDVAKFTGDDAILMTNVREVQNALIRIARSLDDPRPMEYLKWEQ